MITFLSGESNIRLILQMLNLSKNQET